MRDSQSIDQFRLSGAWNFRDVAGAATADGRTVLPGRLFRSSELSRLDDTGRSALRELDVRHVVDLRGQSEIDRSGPDLLPIGVSSVSAPFDDHKGERAPHELGKVLDAASQKRYMMRAYTSFPSLEGAKVAIRTVVDALIRRDGGVLVHCAAGKDRAGWTIATVLRAAGVVDEDVLADFLASNDAVHPLRAHLSEVWADSDESVHLSDSVLGVTEEYYRHGLGVVEELYGSFEGYLDELGIDVEKLKSALLDSTD